MKILITGGAGFVGRHFTERFLKEGHYVRVVDSLVPGTGAKDPGDWYFNPYKFERKFLFFKEDCRDFFKYQFSYDLVLHLAAIVGGRQMIEDKPIAVADDLSIDSAFWQWAVKNKPKKVITFSSSAAYPVRYQTRTRFSKLTEGNIQLSGYLGMPDMSYGWAKLTNEFLGRLAFKKHGILSVAYRPFSGYGNDQGEEYPFASLMNKILNSKDGKIKVWGSANQSRDWIHIDDIVDGVIKTMDKINDGSAINLSTGVATSFRKFVKQAGLLLNKELQVIPQLNKPEGVFYRVGSTKKAEKLGFKPKITLAEGMKRYYELYRNNNN